MKKTTQHKNAGVIAAWCVVGVALIVALFISNIPQTAYNKIFNKPTFSNSSINITANVNTDSSISVTEYRTLQLSQNTTCIKWNFEDLNENSRLDMREVRMATLDAQGAATQTREFSLVSFKPEYRRTNGHDGIGPGGGTYAIDREEGVVYLFVEGSGVQNSSLAGESSSNTTGEVDSANASAANSSATNTVFSLQYSIGFGAQVWRDVAEIDWTFLSTSWPVSVDDITLSVHVPVPASIEVLPGVNVNAWSHAPASSTVAIDSAGSVNFHATGVEADQSANVRLTFPVVWLSNLPNMREVTAHSNDMRLTSIQTSEKKWADTHCAGILRVDILGIVSLAVCIFFILLTLLVYVRFGRDHKPAYVQGLRKSAPDTNLHPAIVGRLWRWNRESAREVVASILHLLRGGYVRAMRGSGEGAASFSLVVCERAHDGECINPISRATLNLLEVAIEDKRDEISLAKLHDFKKENPEDFSKALNEWHKTAAAETDKQDFFEPQGFKWQRRLIVCAIVLILLGAGVRVFSGSNTLLFGGIATCVFMLIIANYMPRRTQAGQDLVAQCKALCAWMHDLPNSAEELAATQDGRDELMIYAHIFDEVRCARAAVSPEVEECDSLALYKELVGIFHD